MKPAIWISAALIALSSSAANARNDVLLDEGATIPAPHEITLSPAILKAGHAAIAGILKDPDSAKWGDEHAYQGDDPGEVIFCSNVNAKNSYGGYAGMGPAWADLKPSAGGFVSTDADVAQSDQIGYFFRFHPACDPRLWH